MPQSPVTRSSLPTFLKRLAPGLELIHRPLHCKTRSNTYGGLFRGTEGQWLKRMYDIKAWSDPGGGIHGSMSASDTNFSERHHPVADGW